MSHDGQHFDLFTIIQDAFLNIFSYISHCIYFYHIYRFHVKNVIPLKLEIETFAIKVERKGEHRFTSTELARELAGSVFELFPKVKVDLKNPNLKVHIKVLNNKCLIYMEIK